MGGGYISGDYKSNCEQAVKLLRGVAKSSGLFKVSKDGVCKDFPTLTYLTSDSTGHVEIANAITASFSAYGIELKTSALGLKDFLSARTSGNYSMARFSWTSAYDDPASFLTLWTAGAGSNPQYFVFFSENFYNIFYLRPLTTGQTCDLII
jgi:ABC-type oligopeptide transport system substrate-binding subunit